MVRALLAGRSTSQLLARWPVAVRQDGGKIPPPDKATVSRWLNGVTFPRSRDELFGLAGAFDVDPLALLGLPGDVTWPGLCDAVRSYNWTPQLAPGVQRFWFLRELILPGRDWPSSDIARNYFGRDWQRQEREHRIAVKRSYYAAFAIEADPVAALQVWHFAWRAHSTLPWRPYGFVRLEEGGLRLCGFDGLEVKATRSGAGPFIVETWFGRGDADFCVASLHALRYSPERPVACERAPTVRFRKAPLSLPGLF